MSPQSLVSRKKNSRAKIIVTAVPWIDKLISFTFTKTAAKYATRSHKNMKKSGKYVKLNNNIYKWNMKTLIHVKHRNCMYGSSIMKPPPISLQSLLKVLELGALDVTVYNLHNFT
jgi:hypothetical protein